MISPGGTIPENTPVLISQNGTYNLPVVAWLTDIRLSCPSATLQASASPSQTGEGDADLTESCSGTSARIVDFPPGGGVLRIQFSSGNQLTAQVTEAESIPCRFC